MYLRYVEKPARRHREHGIKFDGKWITELLGCSQDIFNLPYASSIGTSNLYEPVSPPDVDIEILGPIVFCDWFSMSIAYGFIVAPGRDYEAISISSIFFLCMLFASVGVSIGLNRLRKNVLEKTSNNMVHPATRSRGFTLVEVLVVIVILTILAGIVLSVVISSKRRTRVTREEVQIRNLYVAVGLYEADNEEQSPISLAQLAPIYAPSSTLGCDFDQRTGLGYKDWPANPSIMWSTEDDSVISRMRSPTMVSYYFMRSWERAFPGGRKYNELRNDPEVGLIAGIGLFDCVGDHGNEKAPCHYGFENTKYNVGHPASNTGGVMIEARTDGSIVTRHRNGPCESGMLFGQVFLFQDMSCRERN